MSDEIIKKSLLEWLVLKYPDTPKKRAKQWIINGRVQVGGKVIRKPNEILADPGPDLILQGRQNIAEEFQKEIIIHPRLRLIYLDRAFAIVNKGPELISVPAPEQEIISALSILEDFLAGRLKPRQGNFKLPPWSQHLSPLPVHRLDQYTSGALCIALTSDARAKLIELISRHLVTREYIAYVHGKLQTKRGTWRHWLQLSADEMQQKVLPSGRRKPDMEEATEAVTHFEVEEEFAMPAGAGQGADVISRLRLKLETGRKHQIRAQAAHEGVPLIGDRTYHPLYREAVFRKVPLPVDFDRQALHAEVLGFEHPLKPGRQMVWKAELPPDLKELEKSLRHLKRNERVHP